MSWQRDSFHPSFNTDTKSAVVLHAHFMWTGEKENRNLMRLKTVTLHGFLQTFHSIINFWQTFKTFFFSFQNSKTKFDRFLMHSPLIQYMWYTCTFHLTVQSTVHIHLKVHMPKHCHYMKIIYISHRMKIYSQLFSKSVNCCLFCLIPEDKIHKLSKTSVELFIFHRLLRPWKWQIIFP